MQSEIIRKYGAWVYQIFKVSKSGEKELVLESGPIKHKKDAELRVERLLSNLNNTYA